MGKKVKKDEKGPPEDVVSYLFKWLKPITAMTFLHPVVKRLAITLVTM